MALTCHDSWNLIELEEEHRLGTRSKPDETTARNICLREGVDAPDLATVKDFIRFAASTGEGRIAEKVTADSVNTFAEWLFAGFTRVIGTATVEEDRKEVYNVHASHAPPINGL